MIKVVRIVLFLLVSVSVFSTTFSFAVDAEDVLISQAVAYLEIGDVNNAIDSYEKVLAINPENEQALLQAGFLWFQAFGNITKAFEYAKRLIQIDPDNYLAYVILGHCYAESGKLDMAIKSFEQVLAADPNEEDSLLMLGVIYGSFKNNADRAEDYFLKVVEKYPHNSKALFYLGMISYNRDRDLDRTIEYMQEVVSIDPENDMAYAMLATVYSEKNDPAKAIKFYNKALDLRPNDASYNYGLGLAYEAENDISKARKYMETALKLNKDEKLALDIDIALRRILEKDFGKQ